MRQVHFPPTASRMAMNSYRTVIIISYDKERTWYHRSIKSAVSQNNARGTMRSVGKNDYDHDCKALESLISCAHRQKLSGNEAKDVFSGDSETCVRCMIVVVVNYG